MQFKKYVQGNLEFTNVNSKINTQSKRPLFLFGGEYYTSEEFAIQYYKSKGYDAFFSENKPWKRLLKALFKDVFKEFKKISKQKGYRYGFYDNEFFIICENEINGIINYLKNVNLIEEVKKHRIKAESKNKILKICELLDDDQILSILYYMLQDYNNRIRGFPDLLVFNDEGFFFCEVKANTDVLSAYQVRNHEKLLNTGIDVCLFSINKSQSFIKEEKWKYFNEDFYDVDNFKEKYDFKVKTANKIHEELKDYQIDEIKNKFFSTYDLDIYMGFLNIMKDYPLNKKVDILKNIDEIILNQAKKEGTKIKNLRYLSKGMYYEERGLYLQAIEEYKKANDFYGYNQLCICYKKIKDYENEVSLTYDAINNISGIPSDCKVYFKTRAQRFTKNKKRIEVFKTNNKCPVCGCNEVVVVLQRRNNLKIRICDNGSCYWYGGIYESDLNQLEKVTDLKDFNVDTKLRKSVSKLGNRQRRNKQKSLFEKESKPESDGDYAKNLEIKYELILKGESLLNNKDYDESLEFYTELMDHELFINNDGFSKINLNDFFYSLGEFIKDNCDSVDFMINYDMDESLVFDIDLISPLSLIFIELIYNSIYYDFNEDENNEIDFQIKKIEDDGICFIYKDNHNKLPNNFNFNSSEDISVIIINSLVNQIRGNLEIIDSKNGFKLTFPSGD